MGCSRSIIAGLQAHSHFLLAGSFSGFSFAKTTTFILWLVLTSILTRRWVDILHNSDGGTGDLIINNHSLTDNWTEFLNGEADHSPWLLSTANEYKVTL